MMRQNSIMNGLLLGAALIILAFLLQIVSPKTYVAYGSFLLLPVLIGFMVKSAADERYFNEGFLSLGEGFKTVFITALIGIAMCTTFEYILYNFINPGLLDVAYEVAMDGIEKFTGMMKCISAEVQYFEKVMDEARDAIKKEDLKMTPGKMAPAFLIRLIMPGAICSFIVALIMKRGNNA